MECPRCNTSLPEVAHFCHVCGTDLVSQDGGRKAPPYDRFDSGYLARAIKALVGASGWQTTFAVWRQED